MKARINFIFLLFVLGVFLTMLTGGWQTKAQERQPIKQTSKKLVSPSEEEFQPTDGLAAPWRKSGCYVSNLIYKVPGCHDVGPVEWDRADILSLYNADGSLCYSFSVTYSNPGYFLKNKKTGFLPFAIVPAAIGDPSNLTLRIINESAHWYEVEVNEETRATKYVLRNDSKWAKTD